MAASPPVASVVVLTYDRPAKLGRCLASLSAQSFDHQFEIVVADDGSAPRTADVIQAAQRRDPRIRHVRHPHRGIPAARNLGVNAARGEYVAIVADDYVLAPTYLATALAYLVSHPEAAVVRFDFRPLRDDFGSRISHLYYWSSIVRRLDREGLSGIDLNSGARSTTLEAAGAAVFRREALDDVGPWNEQILRGEDTELTWRLRELGYEVHFLAAGVVRHDYQRVPIDTLRKCFETGTQSHHVRKMTTHPAGARRAPPVVRLVRRGRVVARSWRYDLRYLPFMILFRGATLAGSLWARLISAGAPDGEVLDEASDPSRR